MEQGNEIIYETLQWDGTSTAEYLVADNQANLVYLAENGETIELVETKAEQDNIEEYTECEVTEEVITTDEWVQSQGDDCVIHTVTVDDIGSVVADEEDVTVPLPEAQDEYTTSRPYPCDFCSRRFRKKANLMNHMIAHQNDRPHVCNLCGARYIRKSDLLNHLKTHAYTEDGYAGEDNELVDFIGDELANTSGGSITIEDLMLSPNNSHNHHYNSRRPAPKKRPPKHTNRIKGLHVKPKRKQKKPKVTAAVVVDESPYERYSKLPPRYETKDPNKPFVCQFCGVAFARSKALNSHLRLHAGEIIWECNECGFQFWDKNALNEHKEEHIVVDDPPEPTEVSLDFDDEATVTGSETEYHESGGYEEISIHECKQCDIIFDTFDQLERHQLDHTVDNSNHHCCNVCGETFAEALDLLAHAEIHARDNEPHQCLLCGERFNKESSIKLHINERHRGELTDATCRICGKICKDGRSLMRHSWDHSNDRSHSCSCCAKTFQNKARLKRHMMSHKNKSVVCEECGDEFPDGRSLMNHRHAHTKALQFHCTICGKSFGSRSSQQIHLRYHTGERPYSCRYCWKSFADGGTLRKHERIHTGEKPYACPVCPRAFNQRVVLREHIRSHHSVPDTKNGTSAAPYYCTVCGDVYPTAADLINHLIQHSDNNTAAKRQMPDGPRKYKRRRSRPESSVTQEIVEEMATYSFRKAVPKDLDEDCFRLPEEILYAVTGSIQPDSTGGGMAPTSTPRKAKMINTSRQQGTKTKQPLPTKLFTVDQIIVPPTNIKSESFPLLDDGKPLEEIQPINEQDNFLLDIVNKTNYTDKYDSEIVNDLKEILQSPVKRPPQVVPESNLRNNGRPRRSIKPTMKVVEAQLESTRRSGITGGKVKKNIDIELNSIKTEPGETNTCCQICNRSFGNREALMAHVQVHI